ncbi:MAG: hypothetical protein ACI9XK_004359 [Granulosicoccus sp.]|jgi:hypothetical protein
MYRARIDAKYEKSHYPGGDMRYDPFDKIKGNRTAVRENYPALTSVYLLCHRFYEF